MQFARTPYSCGFSSGWTSFALCTVHIYYGDGIPDDPPAFQEINDLAALLAKRAKRMQQRATASERTEPENMVLLGDFNIFSQKDVTFAALIKNGFIIPKQLQARRGSNIDQKKFYDQVAFMTNPRRFQFTGKAGVFNYYQVVFTEEDEPVYSDALQKLIDFKAKNKPAKVAKKTKKTPAIPKFGQWRTFQMSDHLPLWVELRTTSPRSISTTWQARYSLEKSVRSSTHNGR